MTLLTIERFTLAAERFTKVEAEIIPIVKSNCECVTPGETTACWDCPYYKQLGRLIQKKLHPEPEKVFSEIPPPDLKDPYSDKVKKLCCEMYLHGYSINEIQQLVGIPLRRILRDWLREVGLPKRSANYPEHVKQHCLELYADRWPVRQIENETGVPGDTIVDWAVHAGLSRKCKYPDETKQKCLELYKAGHSSEDIHAMTGIHPVTIRAWIAKADIGRGQKRYSDQEKQHCLSLYINGKTPREIEGLTGVKQATLRSWIRKERLDQEEESEKFRKKYELEQAAKLNREKKPNGYWRNLDNIKREVLLLNEARGRIGEMPTASELQELGRSDLQHAISDHHGGYRAVAEYMNLAHRKRKSGYWENFENLKKELFTYIRKHGEPGVMPTKQQLEQAEKSALSAALTLHGGVAEVARKLKLELSYSRKPRGYWKNLDNLKSEMVLVAEELGNPDVLPTHEELKQLGRTDLISAIAKNGGWPSVAKKLGFSYSKQYNNPNDYFGGRVEENKVHYDAI